MTRPHIPPFIAPNSESKRGLSHIIKSIKHPVRTWDKSIYTDTEFPLKRFPNRRVIIKDSVSLREIFLNRNNTYGCSSYFRISLQPLWGEGLLISEQRQWKWQRKALSPAFTNHASETIIPLAIKKTLASIGQWEGDISRADFFTDLSNLATEISYAALVENVDAGNDYIGEFNIAAETFSKAISTVRIREFLRLPGISKQKSRMAKSASAAIIRNIINKNVNALSECPRSAGNLLSELLKSKDPRTGNPLSRELLLDNLAGTLMAGRDTTGSALFWALHTIASSSATRLKIEQEIESVTRGKAVAQEHVDQFRYLRKVVYEILRLFPPGPILLRECLEDVTLNGRKLRKGTSLIIPVYAIHRDPNIWENPNNFVPERFDSESLTKHAKSFSYLPFGAGQKICIGRTQALLELISIIASLVQNVKMDFTQNDIRVEFSGGFLKPNTDVAVSIQRKM